MPMSSGTWWRRCTTWIHSGSTTRSETVGPGTTSSGTPSIRILATSTTERPGDPSDSHWIPFCAWPATRRSSRNPHSLIGETPDCSLVRFRWGAAGLLPLEMIRPIRHGFGVVLPTPKRAGASDRGLCSEPWGGAVEMTMRVTRWVLGLAGAALIAWGTYRAIAVYGLYRAATDCSNEILNEAVSR